LKRSTDSLYFQYIDPGKKMPQLQAIVRFASKHSSTHIAVFFTVFKGTKSLSALEEKVLWDGLENQVLAFVIYAVK